jgi:hypothetical protein
MMQGLKAEKEDEFRQAQIKKIVEEIYKEAIQVAEKTSDSSYNHEIPSTQMALQPVYNRRQQKKQYLDQLAHNDQLAHRGQLAHNYLQNSRIIPYYQGGPDPFHIKNMNDILAGLRNLFPECAVSHTLLCQAKDGKMYDVAKLDDAVLPFVDRALDQSYIVIDWS